MAHQTRPQEWIEPKIPSYRASLAILALLVAFLILGCLVLIKQQELAPAIKEIRTQGGIRSNATAMLLVEILLLPVVCAILSAILAAQAITMLRFLLYARGLRRWLDTQLYSETASYPDLIPLTGTRVQGAGQLQSVGEEPLHSLLLAQRNVLLLGEPGSGKTTALYTLAYGLTSKRALLRLWLAKAPLPIIVPLASEAETLAEGLDAMLACLMRQVRFFGSAGLAARLSKLARRQGIVVLSDGLDTLSDSLRAGVSTSLAALASDTKKAIHVISSCQTQYYINDPQGLGALSSAQRVVIGGLHASEITQALRQTPAPHGVQRPTRTEIMLTLQQHRLEYALTLPVALAALRRIWRSERQLPYGRAQLYHVAAELMCLQFGDRVPIEKAMRILGSFASALRRIDARIALLDNTEEIGIAIDRWMSRPGSLSSLEYLSAETEEPTPEEITIVCQGALSAGILRMEPEGAALSFSDTVQEALFAAEWLRLTDDGLGRLNAELLRPQWILPMLLWAGQQAMPIELARRILRLSETPDTTAARAGLATRSEVYAAALALALAATFEGFVAALAQLPEEDPASQQTIELAEQHLRDLLDQMQLYVARADQQVALTRALAQIEQVSGPELAAHINILATYPGFSRLARAELITLLGVIASPNALATLVDLLAEPDPIIRQALAQAITFAGVAALGPLREALTHPNGRIRARAGEALALLGEEAAATAIAALASVDAQQRATAARTLGALRSAQAVEPLIGLLDDSDPRVQVAAALALGQIATPEAVTALDRAASSTDIDVRKAVAEALGATHDVSSVPPLLILLNDREGQVRATAATMLGTLGDARAIIPLREHRDDPDVWSQSAAIRALRRLGG